MSRDPSPFGLPSPVNLIGLVRVSTEGQAKDRKAGVERQVGAVDGIVAAHDNASLLFTKIIKGVGGSDLHETLEWRDEILPALQDPHTHLAVDAVDRLLRPDRFNFTVAQQIVQSGTKIYLPGAVLDPEDTAGWIQLAFGALFGGLEKKEFKRRVFEGREKKRRRGEHVQNHCSLPTGISYDGDTASWGYSEDAERVREAYRLIVERDERVLDGVAFNFATVGRLVSWGREERPFSSTTIRNWLCNPIYKGIRRYDTKRGRERYPARSPGRQRDRVKVPRVGDEIIEVRVFGGEGQQRQLVTDEVWEAAHQIAVGRVRRSRVARRQASDAIPYSSYLYSVHGEPDFETHVLYGRGHAGLRDARYECRCVRESPPTFGHPRCGLARLPADQVNRAIDKFLIDLVHSREFINRVVLPQYGGRGPALDAEVERLEKLSENFDSQEERLVGLYTTGRLSMEMFDKQNARLTAERTAADRMLNDALARRAAVGLGNDEERITRYLDSLGGFDPNRPVGFRRGFLDRLLPEIVVSEVGIEALGFRFPQGLDATVQPFHIVHHCPWRDLLGYDLFDTAAHMASEGLFTTAELAKRLGMKTPAVAHLRRQGIIPPGEKMYRKGHVYTLDQVEEIERLLDERDRPPVHRWGLPKKDHYTFGDLRKVTGLSGEELRYRLEKGVIPDGATRTEHGYRQFTEEEFERAVEAWERASEGR